jgi:hypothetical protein
MNITTGIFGFFILCCAYAAQYWAYKSHQELKKMNDKLDQLLTAPLRRE